MAKKKIALIITVKNEEQAIVKLLESVAAQTKRPDEVIIADAGSTDKTVAKIKRFKRKIRRLKILDVNGKNRAEGRNLAIEKCQCQIVAVTDAGCTLKNDWLERITKPIMGGTAEAVAGFYLADTQTPFQLAVAPFVAVMPDQLDVSEFLPSSRSVAFTKDAWEKAGKYPENVEYCEDLTFAKYLKARTKMVVEPRAIVYWQQASNLGRFYRQIKGYAMGDVEARYWPHLVKIATVYIRYGLFLMVSPLFVFYLAWPVIKHRKYVRHPEGVLYLPLLQLTTDLAIVTGSLKGLL